MTGTGDVKRDIFLYFDTRYLQCARLGRWKLHVSRYNSFAWTPDPPGGRLNLPLPYPELYDVVADPSESCDVASDFPDVVADMVSKARQPYEIVVNEVKKDQIAGYLATPKVQNARN